MLRREELVLVRKYRVVGDVLVNSPIVQLMRNRAVQPGNGRADDGTAAPLHGPGPGGEQRRDAVRNGVLEVGLETLSERGRPFQCGLNRGERDEYASGAGLRRAVERGTSNGWTRT